MPLDVPAGVTVLAPAQGHMPESAGRVLTRPALKFVAALHRRFDERRRALLDRRHARQRDLDGGVIPGFLVETRAVRDGAWTVAAAPAALERRRVEITGPVDRKMMINALNSGADAFMADFEDALSPTWANVLDGQLNVQDAVRGTLSFRGPDGRTYALADERATLLLRPRGLHLEESHVLIDGAPVSASLFDFGMAFFHNAGEQLARGAGPFFYLPKLESHLEARWWNDVFSAAEESFGVPVGSARATVLIETVLAAFEMDEILFELRDHAAGLNAGRWDYIFSIVKKFSAHPDMVLPDRAQVTMAVPFMRTYTEQLVRVCHRRGAHAIGGMAAFVPNRRDPAVTEAAVSKVREDKQREADAGFDGTWVAHPDLVPIAMEVFRARLGDRPNQKDLRRDDVRPDAGALLRVEVPGGRVTEAGVRTNVEVALLYLDAWLRGVGAVAIHNLMEDAATAEISRAQLWQWVRHRVATEDGVALTPERYAAIRDEVLAALERERGTAPSRLREAAELLDRLVLAEEFVDFLTLLAYPMLEPDAGALRATPSDDGESRATEGRSTGERPKPVLAVDVLRDYSAADVERLRGPVRVAHTVASLGAARLRALLDAGRPIHALGAVTAAQGAELARGGMEALYAAPSCDVNALSDALVRAQQLAPIIADVGASEPIAVFERTRALVAGGAAAVVLDLSRSSDAECAPALNAARLAADVADVPTVLVARVRDAERGARCAAYADVLWIDGVPADAAARVASRVRTAAPGRPLAYDFSSHADTAGLTASQRALEEAGVRLHLFAGAGALVERLGALALARDFRSRGAAAWAELQALDPGGEARPELPASLAVLSLPSGA